jgi:hypothetical protein
VRARGAPRTLAYAWNALGVVLLCVIMAVALASLPMVGAFGDAQLNTWVAYVPFVWLPCVLVASAIAGHIVVWRRLAIELPVNSGATRVARRAGVDDEARRQRHVPPTARA